MIKDNGEIYSLNNSNPDYTMLYYPLLPSILILNGEDAIALRTHKDFDQFISDLRKMEEIK